MARRDVIQSVSWNTPCNPGFPADLNVDDTPSAERASHGDPSRWLVVAGIVEILIGAGCVLCSLLLVLLSEYLPQSLQTAGMPDGRTLLSGTLALALAAALFVAAGIGTSRARRWARDLALVGSWIWLIAGVVAVPSTLFILSRSLPNTTAADIEPLGSSLIASAIVVNAVVLGFLFILLPLAFVLFYSHSAVKKTFETRNPAGWTSKCPLPVLTLSQFVAGGVLAALFEMLFGDSIPFFGSQITGISAKLLMAVATAVSGYLAWAIYKLRLHAWWMNFVLTMLSLIWFVGTYYRLDTSELLALSGIRFGQAGPGPPAFVSKTALWVLAGVFWAAWLAFLLWVRKYFVKPAAEAQRTQG